MIVTSIDFETANYLDTSICAARIAIFNDGELIESKHWLVRPPKGHGWFRKDFVECHGINWTDVRHSLEFSEIAPEIIERLQRGELVIAHNASFDTGKLRGTLKHFNTHAKDFSQLIGHK